jgi:putative membrane protein
MLLDESSKQRIQAAIADVERTTSGEIVVATVASSDDYEDVGFRYAAAAMIGAAAIAHVALPALSFTLLLSLQAIIGLSLALAFRAGPVVRALTPKRRLSTSVERRARETFLEHELFATRERTGVLILISELEHRVAILGDRGIDHLVHQDGWQAHVAQMIASIRSGHAADGICEVIRAIGKVLAEHLPARSDDENELSDDVRR